METLLFAAFALAFAIKVPVFPLHTWLPDAHTEAPTAGSIILAGVLLKLGVYGYLRFALPLFPDAAIRYAPWLGLLGIIGVIYGAFVAYPQHDMKRLVAYSSVSHLGLVVMGVGAFTTISLQGSILQMVNHGLSTGALFLLVGVLYERTHTREIAAYGGIAARRAGHDRPLPHRDPLLDRPAGPERLRRRVPDPASGPGRRPIAGGRSRRRRG